MNEKLNYLVNGIFINLTHWDCWAVIIFSGISSWTKRPWWTPLVLGIIINPTLMAYFITLGYFRTGTFASVTLYTLYQIGIGFLSYFIGFGIRTRLTRG